jgi:hypothetical protein
MDIMQPIISGGNSIIDDEYDCLLSPSIKCDDGINYLKYSSKILSGENNYKNYIERYEKDLKIDPQCNYLIELPNKKCNVNSDKIKECSNLIIEEPNSIKNIITEESYSLENYINDPELLQEFTMNEPNFFKIFLYEFKKLFEGLKFLSEKEIAHHDISPKNIIFNQQTKTMKFVNFGKRENKSTLINRFKQHKFNKYQLQIYYPFTCFFMNYQNYIIYKNITNEENEDFIKFLQHAFFDEPYTEIKYKNTFKLKEQFKNMDTSEQLKKYKLYIKSNYDKTFFKTILSSFKDNYLNKNQSYSTFIKYIINGIDIYGLSLTTLLFFKILKKTFSSKKSNSYDYLSKILNNMINNSPSPTNIKTCVPEKAFFYFRINYYFILNLLNKKTTSIDNKTINKQTINKQTINKESVNNKNESQYKLIQKNITTHHGILNKNYIDHNGKLMRIFTAMDIFKHLNNLSSYNYSLIKKIIDDDKNKGALNILINKEAYYKIKYNLYCANNEEVNPYIKKCVSKCPTDSRRNFNNSNFNCTNKNKNKNKNNKKSQKKIKTQKSKKCSSGYERNPFTKKCTRKCLPGYIRNLKFSCIDEKNVL